MQINDVVLGLSAGVGIDLSPDGKTAYYVEWSIGELAKVDTATGMVTKVMTGLKFPQDVEVDWDTGDIYVSERNGSIVKIVGKEKKQEIVKPGGAPHQLHLKKRGGKRFLYTVCYDSGKLLRIDLDTLVIDTIVAGLGHPVGLVIDKNEKNAYITEQNSGAITNVKLANGNTTQLINGLTAPFYLAWDKDAKGIFCMQRDPANSLIRFDLSSSTISTIANGLAWRPSGVAPNSDDTLIYTCADQELEVISFKGGPVIQPPKPTFTVHSIAFTYDKSKNIRLKDHVANTSVPTPEFLRNVRNRPAAYTVGSLPKIKVVFKKGSGYIAGSYDIGATGSLGGIRRKTVALAFNASGLSNSVEFEFMWPLPGAVGKPDVSLNWFARKVPGASIPVKISSALHRIYLLLAKPTAPWVNETPWVAALEIACGWANGTANVDDAAGAITEKYFNCGVLSYDTLGGSTFYTDYYTTFYLKEMIDRLNGGIGLGGKVNCTDSATVVSTFANLLGCDLWQSQMGNNFYLNPILAIGTVVWEPPFGGSGFSYHEVAWKGACLQNDRLFDGCLQVDGDADPTTAPHAGLLPKNMIFGDCTTMNYRLRLCPATAGGCTVCAPLAGGSKRRRTVS